MSAIWTVARHEARILATDSFPIVALVFMPLLMLAFMANGFVGGPAQSVPGLMVLFGFFGISLIGVVYFRDHGWRTWHRLRISALSTPQVLVGKALPLTGVLILQKAVLLLVGWAAFDLPWKGSPLVVGLVALSITTLEVSLAMLLVAVCGSIQQLSALGNLSALLFAGLGGGLAPLSSLPDWARTISPASPIYWELQALRSALRGDDLAEVALATGVVLAVAILAAAAASRLYRTDSEKQFFA